MDQKNCIGQKIQFGKPECTITLVRRKIETGEKLLPSPWIRESNLDYSIEIYDPGDAEKIICEVMNHLMTDGYVFKPGEKIVISEALQKKLRDFASCTK